MGFIVPSPIQLSAQHSFSNVSFLSVSGKNNGEYHDKNDPIYFWPATAVILKLGNLPNRVYGSPRNTSSMNL